ncbi:Nucleotidyltransferase domain protein [Sporomusa ovata DSM 2662]|uniref:Nucleotidyltransferase n=1 Tax=Sporomusa ovata TaxID=2378 RepID=A0A0U1KSU7_9FIRM|nr:nucleotidyltransferase domain-containing protein [Sporomusa ovata]EQB26417.1 putative nucleotidyltransferase [Sporomusa ovata DSM 2662]CQR70498.1 nucleotidyltransferase [Sporomusa ovata]
MDNVLRQIKEISSRYYIQKVILFGSRARGDNSSVSDYDIAVFGKDMSERIKTGFYLEVEDIDTLKKIDIVFIDDKVSPILLEKIADEGIVVYEGT